MPSLLTCPNCDFDLGVLRERIDLSLTASGGDGPCPVAGGVANLRCPICSQTCPVNVAKLGLIIRGSGASAQFARWRTEGGATSGSGILVGDLELRFERFLTIEPREACYERVPVFRQADGSLRTPDLPLRTDMFDCLDFEKTRAHKGPLTEIVGSVARFSLYLKGLDKAATIELPLQGQGPGPINESAFADLNLRIWPKADIKGWAHHLVGVAGTSEVGETTLRERQLAFHARPARGDWQRVDVAQRGGGALVQAMTARPEWVSAEMREESGTVHAGGVFWVRSEAVVNPIGEVKFGLDFGTSNTCIAVDDGSGPRVLEPTKPANWNLYVLRSGEERPEHVGPDLWPSSLGFGRTGDVYPSELLLPKTRQEMVPALGTIENWRYGVDYGVPGAKQAPSYNESECTVRYFKWAELMRPFGSTYSERLADFQDRYLAAVLMNALLRATAMGVTFPQTVHVWYSYPMAFDPDDLNKLAETTARAEKYLSEVTGLSWKIEKGLDESTAAARNGGDPGCQVAVYLDMGGGSSDIAIVRRITDTKAEPVFLTSARYAGSALLDAFAGRENPSTRRRDGSCLSQNATVDALHRKVRETPSINDVLADSIFNRAMAKVVERRIGCFYNYLAEYVARLLASALLEGRLGHVEGQLGIGVHFLGNGWGFASRLSANSQFAPLIVNRISKRLEILLRDEILKENPSEEAKRLGETFFPDMLEFQNFVYGSGGTALQASQLAIPPHPKAAVAFGLLQDGSGSPSGGVHAEARIGILGMDTKIATTMVPWFARFNTAENDKAGGPPKAAASKARSWTAVGSSHPYYKPDWSKDSMLDWPDATPNLPEDLPSPQALDIRLSATRGKLKAECSLSKNNGWFAKGPYEVLLETLFKPSLGLIGSGEIP
jgi:hypothetical protein